MALTVTTDLTNITTAETITGWYSIGSGGGAVLEPDFYVQGANCVSRAVSGSVTKGMFFDNGSNLDFTTGTHQDKLVYTWVRVNTPQLAATIAADGLRIIMGNGPANYRQWTVDGSNTIPASEGWICYVVDPQSAGTSDVGTYNANNVRSFGALLTTTTTAKGQNLGIDRISYGRGEVYVSGTVTTAGQGFREIADVMYDSAGTNRWGTVTVKAGVIYVRGKIIIGDATANTTFSSRGETVVFETPYYENGTSIVKAIPDAGVGAVAGADGRTTYLGLAFVGGTGTTTIDMGVLVGTDSGRSGSTFVVPDNQTLTTPAKTLASIQVDDSTMALSLYASTFVGFEGACDLSGTGTAGDDMFACTFNGCGRLDSNMELRNCNILNSVASATDGAYLWNSSTNLESCVFANNSRAVVFESATGSPFDFTDLTFAGNAFDVRNESTAAITINVIGGTTPTYEDVGGGSATTLVINPVACTITAVDINTGSPTSGARVLVTAGNGTGPMPFQKTTTIARSGSTATATCTAHGLISGKQVLVKGADQAEYNGVYTVSNVTANAFDYTVSGTPTTPATGTITSTGVVIHGTTNGSGVISDTRSHAASQPITGRVRSATTGTKYRTAPITGTISNTAGFSVTAQLIPDE